MEFFEQFGVFEHLPDLVANYGYIAVFLVIFLESAGIPLPGETMLITGAIIAGAGKGLNIYVVIAVAAAAAILGDNMGYWVGRRWGLSLLLRYGRYIHLDERKLKLGQYLFMRHGGKIVFIGRFVAVLRVFAAVLAGANAYDARRFFMWNALGGIFWAGVIGALGFQFGKQVEHILGPLGITALVLVVVGGFLAWRFFKMHEARLSEAAEKALPGPIKARPGFGWRQ
jgi:membrane protein DedA with SNARE-associated domain